MMRIITSLLIIVLSFSLKGQNQLLLSKTKSFLNWTAKSTVTGSYSGTLTFKSGKLLVDDKKISEAEVLVDMRSLKAENKELQEHIRSDDFFDVEKFVTASFNQSEVSIIKNDSLTIAGLITIIGESLILTAPLSCEANNKGLIIKGKLIVDRTKFGIYHNSSSFIKRMKEKLVADEFEIEFSLFFE